MWILAGLRHYFLAVANLGGLSRLAAACFNALY
jgi:hypothetical protein